MRILIRLPRLLSSLSALITIICFLAPSVGMASEPTDSLELLRERFFVYLTGGDSIDPSDPDIAAEIKVLENDTDEYLSELVEGEDRINPWPSLAPLGYSAMMQREFQRLSTMATAYKTKGSKYENDSGLGDKIIELLDWMQKNRYYAGADMDDAAWWQWEIGGPLAMGEVLTLMFDDLPQGLLDGYIDAFKYFIPVKAIPVGGDANDIWHIFCNLMTGVLDGDLPMVENTLMRTETYFFMYGTTRNGFYPDGSYLMHEKMPYTGGYGVSALDQLTKIVFLTEGTDYQLKPASKKMLAAWVKDSYPPLIYNGLMMDMVRGRSIARELQNDRLSGHTTIRLLSLIADALDSETELQIKGLVKYWTNSDTYRSIYAPSETMNNRNSVFYIDRIKKLVANQEIQEAAEPIGHYRFPVMSRVVHQRPGYAVALSAYSNNVYSFENMSTENKKGWYTSAGTLYLYNQDQGQFSDRFWPTVNPYWMPGTTVNRAVANAKSSYNQNNWSGGSDLGDYGVTGFYFQPANQTLHARKSWFMFDDEVVALGSGISSEAPAARVDTVVENRKIKDSGNNVLKVNGVDSVPNLVTDTSMVTLNAVEWMHLEGNSAAEQGIGYYFPDSTTISARRNKRNGKWADINDRETNTVDLNAVHVANYMSMVIDHGLQPKNASYKYVLLPNMSAEEVENYSKAPDITVIENSTEAHSVRENILNITGANFWNDAVKKSGFITSDKKASVMVRESEGELEVAVGDPTRANNDVINIELDRQANYIISKDPNVDVLFLRNSVMLTVHTAGTLGMSSTVKLGTGEPPDESLKVMVDYENEFVTVEGMVEQKFGNIAFKALNPAGIPIFLDQVYSQDGKYKFQFGFNSIESGIYTVRVSPETVSGAKEAEVSIWVADPSVGAATFSVEDGNLHARFTTKNNFAGILVRYDAGGSLMLDCRMIKSDGIKEDYDIHIPYIEGQRYKFIIWDDFQTLCPLLEVQEY
ncbi:MAG: polysaccharide lyase 8 family protein [Firmicutes bacterium]|nr:polysaccharide lyase 8 family protein [Bacillota bacterium]